MRNINSWISYLVIIFVAGISLSSIEAQDERIEISSISINASIVPLYIREMAHGTTWDTSQLTHDVGYMTGTGWFGQNDNIVLGAHSELGDRQPSVFYDLDTVEIGAEIQIHAQDTTYTYVVTSLEWVDPTDLTSLYSVGHSQLTLITCDTTSFDGNAYQKRLIVRALPA